MKVWVIRNKETKELCRLHALGTRRVYAVFKKKNYAEQIRNTSGVEKEIEVVPMELIDPTEVIDKGMTVKETLIKLTE